MVQGEQATARTVELVVGKIQAVVANHDLRDPSPSTSSGQDDDCKTDNDENRNKQARSYGSNGMGYGSVLAQSRLLAQPAFASAPACASE